MAGRVVTDTYVRAAADYIAKRHTEDALVTPEQMVEDSRPSVHPLHGYFDWDNKSAGQKWRVQQARTLILIVAKRVDSGLPESPVRVVVRSAPRQYEQAGGFDGAMADPVKVEFVLSNAEKEFRRALEKYVGYLLGHGDDVQRTRFIADVAEAVNRLKGSGKAAT